MFRIKNVLLLLLVLLIISCTNSKPAPEPIVYGGDYCDDCKMKISDERFGGEIIDAFGKVHKYDSVECLLRAKHEHKEPPKAIYVVNFSKPKTLIDTETAHFTQASKVRGPMGTTTVASDNKDDLIKSHQLSNSDVISFDQIKVDNTH